MVLDYCALRRNYIVEHAGPLMVRAYLSERATGGAVASSPRRGGLGGVNVSFSSFLCAKEKDRTLQGLTLHKGDPSALLGMTEGVDAGMTGWVRDDRYLSPVRGVKKHLFARKVAKSLLM